MYGGIYLLINIKAEEQDFKTFEVVTGLTGLLLSTIASIYVYNAYHAQREQIHIQKQEIEDNKKDVEFNRALDIIYKQLEHTEREFKEIATSYYKEISSISDKKKIYEYIRVYNWIFNVLISHYSFYEKITNRDIFSIEDKYLLYDIIDHNINLDVKGIYVKFIELFWFHNEKDVELKKYEEFLKEKNSKNESFSISDDEFEKIIEEDVEVFGFVLDKYLVFSELYKKMKSKQ